MKRFTQYVDADHNPTRCLDNKTGQNYPPFPCPPKIVFAKKGNGMRNAVDPTKFFEPYIAIPVGVGAGAIAGAIAGSLAQKQVKIMALGEHNKIILIAAGTLGFAVAGYFLAKNFIKDQVVVKRDPEIKSPAPNEMTTNEVKQPT